MRVLSLSAARPRGILQYGNLQVACALGRKGWRARKREGDGATPRGQWRPRLVLYRADRVRRPRTALPVRPMRSDAGWCDAPSDRNYNRAVRHPYAASAERLWRPDALYDVLVVLDYNECPRVRGLGSAIFMHVARPDRAPTEGCLALARNDLLLVLARLGRRAAVGIGGAPRKKSARSMSSGRSRSTNRGSGVL